MDANGTEARLASIEARLGKIEAALQLTPPMGAPPAWARPRNAPAPAVNPVPVSSRAPSAGNWLGIIAVICFVLAAGFIIKLSIESGWMTHERQIGVAVLLGVGLIGAGLALLRSDREYASLLPGAGVIVLYLTAFAAHRYYALISFETALAATGTISALCIWLYTRIKHDLYAITSAVGAYGAPALLGFHADANFTLYYFLFCSAAFATISIWVQSRALTLVSAYLAILMSGLIGMTLGENMLAANVLALQFVIFTAGTYVYTLHTGRTLTPSEAWSFLPVLLIFYALEYYFIERIQPGLAPWISLGFAGVLVALYLSAKRYFPDSLGSQALILAFATMVAFHAVYLNLLPHDIRPWLFVVIMLAAAFFPPELSLKRESPLWIPAVALLAIVVLEYLTMVSHLLQETDTAWLTVSFAAFASVWFMLLRSDGFYTRHETYGYGLLAAAHVLAVLGFYRLTNLHGSLAVSASWLMYAAAVMAFAFARKDQVMAKSALVVLAFAAAKALLHDASAAPTLVRIFCLLLTGVVLYGCGLLMRRMSRWQQLT